MIHSFRCGMFGLLVNVAISCSGGRTLAMSLSIFLVSVCHVRGVSRGVGVRESRCGMPEFNPRLLVSGLLVFVLIVFVGSQIWDYSPREARQKRLEAASANNTVTPTATATCTVSPTCTGTVPPTVTSTATAVDTATPTPTVVAPTSTPVVIVVTATFTPEPTLPPLRAVMFEETSTGHLTNGLDVGVTCRCANGAWEQVLRSGESMWLNPGGCRHWLLSGDFQPLEVFTGGGILRWQ